MIHERKAHPKQKNVQPLKKCDDCNYTTSITRDLENHRKAHNYINCIVCTQRIKDDPESIKRHKNKHSDIKCSTCRKGFTSKDDLKEHLKTHAARTRMKRCEKCLKPVVNMSGHRRYCNSIRNIPCDMCSRKFGIKSEMLRHLAQVHLKLRNFKCTLCPKSYTDPTPLRHHMNATHGDGSTFSHCLLCKKTFTTKRRFIEHNMKYHEISK